MILMRDRRGTEFLRGQQLMGLVIKCSYFCLFHLGEGKKSSTRVLLGEGSYATGVMVF